MRKSHQVRTARSRRRENEEKEEQQTTNPQEIAFMEMIEEQQTTNPHEIVIPEASEEDFPSPQEEEADENRQNNDDRQRAMYEAMYGTERNEASIEVESQAESERSGDKYLPTPPEISDDEYNSQKTPGNRK